jgi:hypothetical protein
MGDTSLNSQSQPQPLLATSRRLSTMRRWASLSGQVVGIQIVVQGINALTGLLLVRHLPKQDYAWFTIASSMLATVNLLADGGVSTGLTAIGGGIFNQPGPFARLLHDGLSISFRLAALGLLLAAPFFYSLYMSVAAPVSITIPSIILTGLAAFPSISTVLLNVANRLHTRVRVIQLAELTGGFTRLCLMGGLMFSGWLSMLPVLCATVASGWVQALVVRLRTRNFLQDYAISYVSPLRGYVRSLYANHLFFCLQGQISTWIIGWLAGSGEVADMGALGRLSVLFAAVTAPFYHLASPSIARIQDIKILRHRFLITFLAAFAIAASIVLVARWQPSLFLWLLGSNYAHLTVELPLALSAQGLAMITSLAWVLCLARGWVGRAWITIVSSIVGLAIGAVLFPLNTVSGMLSFTLVSMLPTLVVCLVIIIVNLSKNLPIAPTSSST